MKYNFKCIFFKEDKYYANPIRRFSAFVVDILILLLILNIITNLGNKFGFFNNKDTKEIVILEKNGKTFFEEIDKNNNEKYNNNDSSENNNSSIKLKITPDMIVKAKITWLFIILTIIYYSIFLLSPKQATIGCQLFKIIIVNTKTGKLSIFNVISRVALSIINYQLIFTLLTYFFRKDGALLQDILTDTRVINIEKN